MKARRFLAVVLALSLLLLGLGAGAWWLLWQRSPLQLQHRPLVAPRAARFVPRDAALSLHLLVDGQQPLDYARAVAPVRQRRQASEALARLRDGAFAAAGLDYSNDLASWLGPETGLWLLQGEGPGQNGWVLALSSRDGDGARRFLQRFWQSRSLAGSGLQISSYRGMGLISGRGALVGQEPAPLATALIDDDLVLLASGRGALEQALDVSQIDELNQAADPRFRQALERLGEGALLLSARPAALGAAWPDLAALHSSGLVAALRPEGRSLVLDALLEPPATTAAAAATDAVADPAASTDPAAAAATTAPRTTAAPRIPAAPLATAAPVAVEPLLEALRGSASGLALLQDPAHGAAAWQDLLQPWLQAQEEAPAAVPELLRNATSGPLLWSRTDDAWLLATAADQPPLEQLEPAFAAAGLVAAPLDLEGEPVQVWTSFQAGGRGRGRAGGEQLQVNLAVARSLQDGYAWWSDALPALLEQRRGHDRPRQLLERLQAVDLPQDSLRWALERTPAQRLLQRSSAWQLLSALAGEPLVAPVQGLALAVQPEVAGQRLQARLDYGD